MSNRPYHNQGDTNISNYDSLQKPLVSKNVRLFSVVHTKPEEKTVDDLLELISVLQKEVRRLKKLNIHLKNRADKWLNKYKEDLKNYDKIMLDNDKLHTANNELNLMHHQSIIKILNLGQEIKKLNYLKNDK